MAFKRPFNGTDVKCALSNIATDNGQWLLSALKIRHFNITLECIAHNTILIIINAKIHSVWYGRQKVCEVVPPVTILITQSIKLLFRFVNQQYDGILCVVEPLYYVIIWYYVCLAETAENMISVVNFEHIKCWKHSCKFSIQIQVFYLISTWSPICLKTDQYKFL